jgi:hypothetical protein
MSAAKSLLPSELVRSEQARQMARDFRQINTNVPRVHHDALEFPDGTCVLLTDLLEGQEATVLQLPAQPKTPAEEAAQRRVVYVG